MQGPRHTTALFVTVALFSACTATPQPQPSRTARTKARDHREVETVASDLRAKAALEFHAIPLMISGIIVNGKGEFGIILNKEVFQEGDWVTDQLFFESVERALNCISLV